MSDWRTTTARRLLGPLGFYLLATAVGIVAGLGAVVFRGLIALVHNLLFLGRISVVYDANVHTPPGPFGPLVVLAPVLGAAGVAFLVKNFAPEAKGHGVPEVLDAIYYQKGVIRPIVAVIKSLASALTIGSGGSAGREGPMIQIGASFGSTLAQWFTLAPWQRITLIAAGAGGGIAASFNTPVGGILFAIEIMMHELSVRTLVPVAISTATATYVSRLVFGAHPSFIIPDFETPHFHVTDPRTLLSYIVLGVVAGLASSLFIKCLYLFEDFFEGHARFSYYLRHCAAMLLVGTIFYVMMRIFGHYYIEGVGYATVQDVLTGKMSAVPLLLLLFVLKMVATSLTLGSGASGGIFSPTFFMGATLGGACGVILVSAFPGLMVSPAGFAVAGMAGMVGASTGAAVAAIVMIFEMTLDYGVIIPMTITVALAYGIRRMFSKESIYTIKLVRRGHRVPESLRANLYELRQAGELMDRPVVSMPASSSPRQAMTQMRDHPATSCFLLEEDGQVAGILEREAAVELGDSSGFVDGVRQIASKAYIVAAEDTPLFDLLAAMRARNASVALIARREGAVAVSDIRGVITKRHVAQVLADVVELFADRPS